MITARDIELNLSRVLEKLQHERQRLIQIRDSNMSYDIRCAAVFELLSLRNIESKIKPDNYGKFEQKRTTAKTAGRKRNTEKEADRNGRRRSVILSGR